MGKTIVYSSHIVRLNIIEDQHFLNAVEKWAKDRDLKVRGAYYQAVLDAMHEAVMDWITKIELAHIGESTRN